MNERLQTDKKVDSTQVPIFKPTHSHFLQRKCACGGSPGMDGECAECRRKRLALQSRSTNPAELSIVPPIMHEVLHSSGQPLDQTTRNFMEPRFGHDFSRVRVHRDAQAAESARAVNALAYTVGRDVVFGEGQYAPSAVGGRRLLAHELTHTIQQSADGQGLQGKLQITAPGDAAEQEAEAASTAIAQGHSFATTLGKPMQIARQGSAAPAAAAPAASGLGAGSISVLVTPLGNAIVATGTFSPCTDCTDGLESIQVVWAKGGPSIGSYQTLFPPPAAAFETFGSFLTAMKPYDSAVDGGKNSPGGAVYSGDHPYYVGRPDLPSSYGHKPGQKILAGGVSGCTVIHYDQPDADQFEELFFETAFVCLNYQGKSKDKLLNSFKWGWINKGAEFKPSPDSSRKEVEQSSSPSAKFKETLKADYPGYAYV